MDKSILNQFRNTVTEKNLGIYGIHIYKVGEEVVTHRYRADDKVCLYSGSKTFTSVAVGICVDRGLIKLDDRMCDYFPEYADVMASGTEKIKLVDLLHMSSGKVFNEEELFVRCSLNDDWMKVFFELPMTHESGKHYFYSNVCTYTLGRIVAKVTGKSLRDLLVAALFTPLSIFNPQWQTCPQGHTFGATGLFLTTSEFAKMGKLLMQGGVYDGKQLVSKEYVSLMINDIVPTNAGYTDADWENGYGYQLWRGEVKDSYRADGMYGQFSIVFPDKETVVTITSHEERSTQDILTAVNYDIYPYL